jgi:AcrR family transcriptional regulator
MYGMQEPSTDALTELEDLWPPLAVSAPRPGAGTGQQRRRRDTTLTRDRIVRAAVTLADAEGPAAVTMRRIAMELGVGVMSLYWYVADKEQLLDLMLDVVEGESGISEVSVDRQADFRRIAGQRRRALLNHPWVLHFMSGREHVGPNALLHIEQSLSVLDGLNLDTRTALHILMTIDTYVTGSVLSELREMRVEEEHARAELDDSQFAAGRRQWLERLNKSGMFERVVRVFAEGIDPDAAETRTERFEFGLDCVLAGIAALVPTMHHDSG